MSISDHLTITSLINKDSVSKSVIFKGIFLNSSFNHEHVFIKLFKESEPGLKYERDVYNSIHFMTHKSLQSNYLRNNIVIPPIEMKNNYTYNEILQCIPFNSASKNMFIHEIHKILTNDDLMNTSTIKFCLTITYDYNDVSVYEMLTSILLSIDEEMEKDNYIVILNDLVFEIIYCIYILNHYLNINHNDCHFDNFRVSIIPKREVTYLIDNKLFKKSSCVNVRIYDFDRSFFTNNNPVITDFSCRTQGVCNKKTTKDTDILYMSFVSWYFRVNNRYLKRLKSNEEELKKELEMIEPDDRRNQKNIIRKQLEENISHLKQFKDLLYQTVIVFSDNKALLEASFHNLSNETKIFWNTRCNIDERNRFIETECEGKFDPEFDIKKVMSKFIETFYPTINKSIPTLYKQTKLSPISYKQKYKNTKQLYLEISKYNF